MGFSQHILFYSFIVCHETEGSINIIFFTGTNKNKKIKMSITKCIYLNMNTNARTQT
jgi:hypothetical protein